MAELKLLGGEKIEVDKFGKVKRGKGRPKGKWIPASFRYRPVKWEPKFNQIVYDYLAVPGITYEKLGEKYGYCKQQIGNILCSPQAELIKQALSNSIVSRNQESIPVLLSAASEKVAQRIADFMLDDNLYKGSPFEYIDRTLRIGKAVGVINKEQASNPNGASVTNNNTQINIGTDAIRELTDSLNLANKLRAG